MQLKPAITDYTAEVLCKIRAYQQVRDFATNVESPMPGWVPLRFSFDCLATRSENAATILRSRTSARTITAVIAGAIAGLFNPAQGTSSSHRSQSLFWSATAWNYSSNSSTQS